MKPQTIYGADMKMSGNMDVADRIVMDISIDDRAHLMSLLTNLYSDRIAACIREYSTNARDAHIMGGIPERPIEVYLPTALSQYFKVRDFGPGLDIEGLTKYYARYGASAKRDSDETNGTLGIGCKAALTYTPTFSVTSVKDGIKYSVAITLNEEGVGELNVISKTPTSEPSGVEVAIPVKRKDFWDFDTKAKRFFRWWDNSLFKGVPSEAPAPLSILSDGLFTYRKTDVSDDLIIMGGVAYPIPYEGGLLETDSRDYSIVYHASMGEVVFAPSREALMTGSKTKMAIDSIRNRIKDNIATSVSAEFKNLTNGLEAIVKASEYRKVYAGIDLSMKWKGKEIPTMTSDIFKCHEISTPRVDASGKPVLSWNQTPIVDVQRFPFWNISPHAGRRESERTYLLEDYNNWNIKNLVNLPKETAFVLNVPKEISASARKTVRDFYDIERAEKRPVFQRYIGIQGDKVPGIEWLNDPHIYEWDAIKATVRAANKVTGPSYSDRTKYDFYDPSYNYESRKIADSEKVLVTTSRVGTASGVNIAKIGADWSSKLGFAGVVVMGMNRWDKFLREHPNARTLDSEVARRIETWYDGKKGKELLALYVASKIVNRYGRHTFEGVDASKFDDPDLRKAIELANDSAHGYAAIREVEAMADLYTRIFYWNMRDVDVKYRAKNVSAPEVKEIPAGKVLVDAYNYYEARCSGKHSVEIANALYFTKKNKKGQ